MPDEDIIHHYKELSRIEDCFRVTKSELCARPVYVRLKEHIEAHFLICFIALVILRILQFRTNRIMSSRRFIDALNSTQANELGNGYYHVQASDDFTSFNHSLGLLWNHAHVKTEHIHRFSQGWFPTGVPGR